jgi:polysaccharide export outer membrane protein
MPQPNLFEFLPRVRRVFITRLLFVSFSHAVAPLGAADAHPGAAPPQPMEVQAALSTYKVGPGDVISVRVVGEDDLSLDKVRLTDAGTVFFPALGELQVGGLTVGELETLVTGRLRGRILVNPQVLVQVNEYRPFFINGMVQSPGSFPYQPGLNINKAAALAGGFHERASMSKIFIIREGRPSDEREKANLDTQIFPGDMIIVQESFF